MYRFLDTRVRALNIGRTQLMLPMCVLLQLMVPPPHHEFSARMVEYLQAVQGRMSEGGWVLGQGGPPGCGCGDEGARPGPGGSGNVARWGGQTFAFGGVKKLVRIITTRSLQSGV